MTLPLGTRIACMCECSSSYIGYIFCERNEGPDYVQTHCMILPNVMRMFFKKTTQKDHSVPLCLLFSLYSTADFPQRALRRKTCWILNLSQGPLKRRLSPIIPHRVGQDLRSGVNKVWGEHTVKHVRPRRAKRIRSRRTPAPGTAACSLAGKQEVVWTTAFYFSLSKSVHVHVVVRRLRPPPGRVGLVRIGGVSADTTSVPAFTLWSINCFNIIHAYFSATER